MDFLRTKMILGVRKTNIQKYDKMTDIELKKAQKEVMTNHQVDSLCKLIDGKLSRVTCVDCKGRVTKKIIIEYQDD